MNQSDIIYNQLNGKDRGEFISACISKQGNLYGVPRLIVNKNSKIKTQDLTEFFNKSLNHFKEIDDRYYSIIESETPSNSDFLIIFDHCQLSFIQNDDLFDFLPEKLRKKFNINIRHFEKEKFILSNYVHFSDEHLLVTQSIKEKLNTIWSNKWGNTKAYINDFDFLIIDNIC